MTAKVYDLFNEEPIEESKKRHPSNELKGTRPKMVVMDEVNDWGSDEIPGGENPPVPLPKALADLRDGTAQPNPNEGQAREQRLENMQANIVKLQAFKEDLVRYIEFQKDAPLVGTDVRRYMDSYLGDMLKSVKKKIQRTQDEMIYIREHS